VFEAAAFVAPGGAGMACDGQCCDGFLARLRQATGALGVGKATFDVRQTFGGTAISGSQREAHARFGSEQRASGFGGCGLAGAGAIARAALEQSRDPIERHRSALHIGARGAEHARCSAYVEAAQTIEADEPVAHGANAAVRRATVIS